MAMVFVEEPIVSRLDRLDVMLKHLEEIKGYNRSPRSSYTSTPSTRTHVSDEGTSSSVDSSPKSNLEKRCRPIDTVIIETEIKGNLIDRLHQVEDRLLKLCIDLEAYERKKEKTQEDFGEEKKDKKEHKKGLKQFVKSCVKGKHKHKN
ncbi:hypothetical protein AQUCO_01400816v1 [Aquilegia coerulea]|uniref:Uncharacterized protein n=1 Tax=Aquilegia coerulea TaxID=218851 RepID=A0A2G5DYD4_AQUCA|nr:hypothetical protein AQUCO_01400816v1 [Aquilegia coerulea]